MPLEIGSTLNLQLREIGRGDLNLADYRGTSNVFVYFMRALSCAQCNAAVRTLATQQAELAAAGVQVIVAVPEDEAAATVWKSKRAVPFPVVIGKDGTAHAEAGLLRKVFGAIQQSGGVLLDKEGTVRYSHISTNPGASYNKADLAAAIETLTASTAA